jgi:hypothetical protein
MVQQEAREAHSKREKPEKDRMLSCGACGITVEKVEGQAEKSLYNALVHSTAGVLGIEILGGFASGTPKIIH